MVLTVQIYFHSTFKVPETKSAHIFHERASKIPNFYHFYADCSIVTGRGAPCFPLPRLSIGKIFLTSWENEARKKYKIENVAENENRKG